MYLAISIVLFWVMAAVAYLIAGKSVPIGLYGDIALGVMIVIIHFRLKELKR